jgi:hypothetical protein
VPSRHGADASAKRGSGVEYAIVNTFWGWAVGSAIVHRKWMGAGESVSCPLRGYEYSWLPDVRSVLFQAKPDMAPIASAGWRPLPPLLPCRPLAVEACMLQAERQTVFEVKYLKTKDRTVLYNWGK